MALPGVDLDINLKIGTDQLNQLNDQIQTSLNRGLAGAASTAAGGLGKVDKGLDGIRSGAKRAGDASEDMLEKLSRQLEGIAESSQQAADASASIFSRISVEDQIGSFGDLKDVFEKTAGSLLGMSEAAIEAAVSVGDIAEKGANIGKVLGPEFAAFGFGVGLVIGGISELIKASDKAKEAQVELAVSALAKTQENLAQQQAALAATAKVWDDYALAVRRANGTQISLIEGLVDADKAQFDEEQKGRQERLKAYQDNLTKIKEQMIANRVSSLSVNEVFDLEEKKRLGNSLSAKREEQLKYSNEYLANEAGKRRVEAEIADAAAAQARGLAFRVSQETAKAFEASEAATADFNKELLRIKSPPTLKDLKKDQDEATAAMVAAEKRVIELKSELAAPIKAGEGFEAYTSRIKGLLVDASVAAGLLSQAQAEVIAAASAVEAAKPTPTASTDSDLSTEKITARAKINISKTREEVGRARVELDQFVQGLLDAPITAEVPLELEPFITRADRDAQLIQDAKAVESLNKEEAYQQNLIKLGQDYRDKKREAAEREAEEFLALREKELQASTDLNNALWQGAAETATLVADALLGEAVEAYNRYLDAIANGEKTTKEERKRNRAEFLRDTGSRLITDGTGHLLMGAAKAVVPATRSVGIAEAAAGVAEMTIGAGMGGVGALAQRRLGGTADNPGARGTGADGGPAVSALDNASNGTQDKGTVNITINNGVPQTERGAQEQALMLAGMLGKRPRRGPAS